MFQNGPVSGHTHHTATDKFMYIYGYDVTGANNELFATLTSPIFHGQDHPRECMSFWFETMVRTKITFWIDPFHVWFYVKLQKDEKMRVLEVLVGKEQENAQLLWRLVPNQWDKPKSWNRGQVQIDALPEDEYRVEPERLFFCKSQLPTSEILDFLQR